MHEPLSLRLAQVLEMNSSAGALTLNRLLEQTEERGLLLIIILLCLPFVLPVSVPGMSTPFGLAIGLLALRLGRREPPHLPPRLGNRALPPKVKRIVLGGGMKFLRFIEKGIKPRHTNWMKWNLALLGNSALLMLMAFLLALPLPPVPPFTNALPSYAIILIAASMMEEDGVMIWAGYAVAVFTVAYFGFWAGLIATHFVQWFEGARRLFGG